MNTPQDFDPAKVPVLPAATVMVIDDRPQLSLLMVRRTSRVVFAPDNWVFPGGRVDAEDHTDNLNSLFVGLTDAEASACLELSSGGLAWWLAACRETLEEAGLLLATPDSGAVDVAQWRDQVRQDGTLFHDLLMASGVRLDATALEEIARFITPMGSPRRFDARFFVARLPAGQEPQHDAGEIVDWSWVRPREALERWAAGEFEMMTPTVRMVACLERYGSAEEVMTAARRRLPYRRVRVADPEGAYRVVLPGEPGYETAELEIESGWVRLWEP